MKTELIDGIYEAAFVSDLWPSVLQRLADVSEWMGSALFVFADGQPTRGRAIESQRELLAEFLASDTYQFSTAVTRMCDVQPASFVDVDKFMTPEEIQNDPMRMRLRSIGIGAHVCTAVPMPTGELAIFVLQRGLDQGAYGKANIDLLDKLRPHLRARQPDGREAFPGRSARHGVCDGRDRVAVGAAWSQAVACWRRTGYSMTCRQGVFVPTAFAGNLRSRTRKPIGSFRMHSLKSQATKIRRSVRSLWRPRMDARR